MNTKKSKKCSQYKIKPYLIGFFFCAVLFLSFFGFVKNAFAANPPYVPENFTLTYTAPSSVVLNWTAPFGTVPTGYHIYRDHELIATVPTGSALTWSDTLPDYGIYAYAVRAYNDEGDSDIRVHRTVAWIDPSGKADKLRQWGITWQFDQEYDFGQFANGDFWVSGPVNIVGIDPAYQIVSDHIADFDEGEQDIMRAINGAMLDPYHKETTNPQGYDSGQRNYDDSLNVAKNISVSTPLTISGGHSLVSAISNYPLGTTHRYYTRLKFAAVLTVVSEAPAAGSFRPSYAIVDKTIQHNKSELNYSALQKLALPAGESIDLDDEASRIERVFLDNNGRDFDLEAKITPDENMAGYGRDVSRDVGEAALILNLNYSNAEKEEMLINFVQMGLDLYGVTQTGIGNDGWRGWGGHFSGRKLPIIFAGIVLNDDNMKNVNASFAEDTLTYYYNDSNLPATALGKYSWTGSKVLYKFNYNWDETDVKFGTVYEHKEPSDWILEGEPSLYIGEETCEGYRTCCTAKGWTGIALAVRLMNAESIWNNQSFLDYTDRWVYEDMTPFLPIMNAATGKSVLPNAYQSFYSTLAREMWADYRNMTDEEAPTKVENLSAFTLSDDTHQLYWNRAGDNIGGVGYKIYRNGSQIGTVYTTAYLDTDVISSPVPQYNIVAFDWTGNEGISSDIETAFDDTVAPASPSGLAVS